MSLALALGKTLEEIGSMSSAEYALWKDYYREAPFEPWLHTGLVCSTIVNWAGKQLKDGTPPLTAADCYRFVLSNPLADLCMTGPASAEEMDEALTALDLGPLREEEMERVRRIGDHVRG